MNLIKLFIKALIFTPAKILSTFFIVYEKLVHITFPQLQSTMRNDLITVIDKDVREVIHQNKNKLVKFKIHTPNEICAVRHNTFSTKEPEMLDWIEQYGEGGTFFDIGANIGIYSLYYAKSKGGKVVSFEPSVFNLRQLAKNVSLNRLENSITIVPNPLSNSTGVAVFKNDNSEEGGALSSFGVDYGHDGKTISGNIRYAVTGFSLDDFLKYSSIGEYPNLIKIDVDGIEHLILSGAKNTLKSKSLKSVYIEVNDDFEEQSAGVKKLLEETGFHLKEKRRSIMIEKSSPSGKTFNQIWVK